MILNHAYEILLSSFEQHFSKGTPAHHIYIGPIRHSDTKGERASMLKSMNFFLLDRVFVNEL